MVTISEALLIQKERKEELDRISNVMHKSSSSPSDFIKCMSARTDMTKEEIGYCVWAVSAEVSEERLKQHIAFHIGMSMLKDLLKE